MRRPPIAAALLLIVAAAIAPATVTAEDQTAGADHPVTGAWLIDTDPTCDCPPDQVVVLGPGGTLVDWSPSAAGYGTWASTGDRTADVTFLQPQSDGQGGFAGFATIRSSVEVAPDGQSFAGTFTVEFPAAVAEATGLQPGEYGPGPVTGQRIAVEAMGTPVGPLPQEQPGPEASPGASPAG
jgi:hypothetical protein